MLLILQEDIEDVKYDLSHVVLELFIGSLVNLWGLRLVGLLGCSLLLLLFVLGFLFPLVRPFRLLFHLFKL